MIASRIEKAGTECVRVWFTNPRTTPEHFSCLFMIKCCKSQEYLRSLVQFMKYKYKL